MSFLMNMREGITHIMAVPQNHYAMEFKLGDYPHTPEWFGDARVPPEFLGEFMQLCDKYKLGEGHLKHVSKPKSDDEPIKLAERMGAKLKK